MHRFDTDFNPQMLPAAFAAMMEIVPWRYWEQRAHALSAFRPHNPAWQNYILERHGIELALVAARNHLRATGRWQWPPRTPEEARLAAFMVATVRIYGCLGSVAK